MNDDVTDSGVFHAVLDGYDAVYGALGHGETLQRVWRANAYGGDFPEEGWRKMIEDPGFTDVSIGPPVDNFGGTSGEQQARAFDVFGYSFLAFRPAR